MKLKLRGKLLSIIISLFCVFGIVVTLIIYDEVVELVESNELTSDLSMAYELLDTEHKGEWNERGGKLYKGDTLINENHKIYEIIDKVKEKTGAFVTIFHNDIRVSTNVSTKDGDRAVGTSVSNIVSDRVLKEGKNFVGEADVLGKKCITKYIPIRDRNSKVIGMFFVGVTEEDVDKIALPLIYKVIIIICIAILIGIIIAALVVDKIAKNVKKVVYTLNQVQRGNLAAYSNINSSDEIGEISNTTNRMIDSIKELIVKVKLSSNNVFESSVSLATITEQSTTATNEVTKAVEYISTKSGEQAHSTETGELRIKELTNNIERVIESSEEMKVLSDKADRLCDRGLDAVDILNGKSAENSNTVMKINEVVLEVDKSSDEIGLITETIREISEQTNLLALNAAIEAARAGEHGAGFAVVADEVRKLAEQSSLAAIKVKELIDVIQNKSKAAVNFMVESKNIFKELDDATKENENIFGSISAEIKILKEKIEEVQSFSGEMDRKKNEIVSVIEEIAVASKDLSLSTQEVSASSEEQLAVTEEVFSQVENLEKLANTLKQAVAKFNV